jgi:hypothetical protein
MISEHPPIHFSPRGKCLSNAYENLQHIANNRALPSKTKDIWEETPWMQGFNAEFLNLGDVEARCPRKPAFSDGGDQEN